MQDLKITLIQTHQYWRDKGKNLELFDTLLDRIGETTDLIVFPEMFTTGFTIDPVGLAEAMDGPTMKWLFERAESMNAALIGSFIANDDGKYFNRMFLVEPDGRVQFYDKRHLFRMAREDQFFTPGTKRVIFTFKTWNILPMVCFDLRFPVWMRNHYSGNQYEYDLAVVVANWPAVRSLPWKTLLAARAMENQCYVAGVNRIGTDDNGIAYSGDSMVVDMHGHIYTSIPANEQKVETVTISKTQLAGYRRHFFIAPDWDRFELK